MAQAQTTYQGLPPEKPVPMTVADYMALDGNFEIHQGELVEMSPNTHYPMHIAGLLYASILSHVTAHNLGRVTIEAAYVLDADERTDWVRDARQPDVAFISREKFEAQVQKYANSGPLRVVPDLAIEVVSPSDSFTEVLDKVEQYLGYGVEIVMVVDPERQKVNIYSSDEPDGKTFTIKETLSAEPVIPGWSIPLSEVFGTKP